MMHHETLKEATREAEVEEEKEREMRGGFMDRGDIPVPKTSQIANSRLTD